MERFKEKRFGALTEEKDEFDFENDSDLNNYDANGDILDDAMSLEDDNNFKNKSKLKGENEEEYLSGDESDEVSLD